MRAGKLDRLITIERKTASRSPTGAAVDAWTEFVTVRAEVVTVSALETPTGFGEAEIGTLALRVRYLAELTSADRIIYEGRAYNIKEVAEIGRRRGLEIRAVFSK